MNTHLENSMDEKRTMERREWDVTMANHYASILKSFGYFEVIISGIGDKDK